MIRNPTHAALPGPIRSARQHAPEGTWDAIVIGSGIGGLTAAAILAGEGQRVAVLERHYTAGGFTHVFHRRHYEWDVGIHYIGGMTRRETALRRVFDHVTGAALEWADMGEVYDRIIFGDEEYDFHAGPEAFVAGLHRRFPEAADRKAIESYVGLLKRVRRDSGAFFAEKALPSTMSRIAGRWMRRDLLRYARRTTLDVLRELTDNPKLIGVLTGQYGDIGLPPGESSFAMHALLASHYLDGGAFPVGGSSRIAETIAETIAAAGGAVFTCAEVDRLLVHRRRAVGVRLADGRELRAPVVISGAGVINTFTRLVPGELARSIGVDRLAETVRPSVSHLALYLGYKQTAAQLGLAKTNLWIYPDGGYDHDANVRAYLADPQAELPVVYGSFASAKDPDWERRHPGTATVDLITLAPYERFARWESGRWRRRGRDYEKVKQDLAERMLAALHRRLPQLRGKEDVAEVSSPLSTRHFANYGVGEIYGLEHTPARFEHRFLRPRTPLRGLWLTGQDVTTCGVGGAMMAGVLTASAIRRKNYLKQILKAGRPTPRDRRPHAGRLNEPPAKDETAA